MAHVVLVRHGRAAAAWDEDLDPGLDEVGRRQADDMAGALALFGPLPLLSSPLRRCRETAAALERRWGVQAIVNEHVGEIQSPDDADVAARGTWLRSVMGGRWSEQPGSLLAWRERVLDAVRGLDEDSVVVSHFIAINAVVGAAMGDDRVVVFAPDNCSRTEVNVEDGRITVVELGGQGATRVQ